ncbi:universal stress protein [Janibacter sp. GXQ6167]|uniref:universal stress protein n=1 Tax=Janibacter sp. GXQ6167 TaxID=3240791 RepID=UPI0035235B22
MILVAYSGTESHNALHWAAQHALRCGQALTILTVINLPRTLYDEAMGVPPEFVEAATALLDEAVGYAKDLGVSDIETQVGYRDITGAIVEMSREADLVVVGNRGKGETASTLLGSVAYAVTSHAACPVVVIRDHEGSQWSTDGPVVVGIDGSRSGVHAGFFAAEYAQQAGLPLEVVGVWDVGGIGHLSAEFAARVGVQELHSKEEAKMQGWVDQAVQVLPERFPDVEVTGRVERGSPVVVLRDAAQHASLLVVGTRGRGGFAGLLLGSVSHRIIHDAGCPVAVIR